MSRRWHWLEFDGIAAPARGCWSRVPGARRRAGAGPARRGLPQQCGQLPSRRDDDPLPDGDRGAAARAAAGKRLKRCCAATASRFAGSSTSARMRRKGASSKAPAAWCSTGPNRRAFATLGPRTDAEAIAAFDQATGYSTMTFAAADRSGKPIYHTNVLLSLGSRYAILCAEAVAPADRERLIDAIEAGGRTIIHVDFAQMEHFACNALELQSRDGRPLIALSAAALASFHARPTAAAGRLRRAGRRRDPDHRGGRRRQRALHDRGRAFARADAPPSSASALPSGPTSWWFRSCPGSAP